MVWPANKKIRNRAIASCFGFEIPYDAATFDEDYFREFRYTLEPSLYTLEDSDLVLHALLLGATGSGKTVGIHHLITQEIWQKRSFVVLDMRGDLVDAALAMCQGQVAPERIKIIDLREKKHPMGFNPLAGRGEPYFHALNLLKIIQAESPSWGIQLEETMSNAFLALAESKLPLTVIDDFFTDQSVREQIIERIQSERVRKFWVQFSQLSRDKQQVLAAPVLNKVSALFATQNLRAILGSSNPVDIGAHLDTPGSVLLVCLAADQLHHAGRMMGSLILGAISREIFARVSQEESKRNPVRLFVDEFEHFGTEEFETLLAEGRRFKLSLVLAHQTLAQLNPRLRANILGNVGLKILLRLSRDDSHTMSMDLTGRKAAIDFTTLGTGEAVIWQKGKGIASVVVNKPLFEKTGWHRPVVKQFSVAVYMSHHLKHLLKLYADRQRRALKTPQPSPSSAQPTVTPPTAAATTVEVKPKARRQAIRLEEWL